MCGTYSAATMREATNRPNGAIYGREAPIALIDQLLARSREQPSALLIEGEAGSGKSTMFREAMRLAEQAGFSVLSSRAAATESGFALAALGDMVQGLPAGYRSALPEPQHRAIEVALHLTDPASRPITQSALAAGVRSLIAVVAAERPVLLALDDVQWLDSGSATILGFVMRRLGRDRVAVLATKRVGGTAPIVLEELLSSERVSRFLLLPLSLGAIASLLAERLEPVPSRSSVLRIYEASGGNPLYAIELARLLAEHGPVPAGEPLPVPSGVGALIGERVARLPKATRELLLAAALTRRPELATLERIVGTRPGVLAPAERTGIVSVDRGMVAFSHPLHAAAIVEGASPADRRLTHSKLAEGVDDPEERATHLGHGVEAADAVAAGLVEAGAASAAARGRLHAAADLLERARALTPSEEPAAARRRGLRAAAMHAHAGERGRSRSLLEVLITEQLEPDERADALRLLGELKLAEEDLVGAEAALAEALRYADDQGRRATIKLVHTYLCTLRLDFVRAAELADEALADLRASDDPALLAEALARSAMCGFLIGRGIDRDKLDRAITLADPERMTLPGLGAGGVVGVLLAYAGRHAEARAILATVRRSLSERGNEAELATVMVWISWLETRAGDFAAARAAVQEATWIAKVTSNAWIRRLALGQEALLDAHVGEVERAVQRIREVDADPVLGLAQIRIWDAATRALIGNSVGDHHAAWNACRDLVEIIEKVGIAEPVPHLYLPDAIEALIRIEELDRAEALIDALSSRGRELDRGWAIATAARCQGLLLAARGDLTAALAVIDAALTEHDRIDMPFERARALLVKGSLLRRARQRGKARQVLAEATAEFGRLGATRWKERSKAELDRVAGARRASTAGLTVAELRTAELARAGQSNKEIAEAMFVTVHTVEVHLAHAYAKLGVRSRAQLARRLPVEPDPS
jgi:DNA-binding CsgD family transcriptional regulator